MIEGYFYFNLHFFFFFFAKIYFLKKKKKKKKNLLGLKKKFEGREWEFAPSHPTYMLRSFLRVIDLQIFFCKKVYIYKKMSSQVWSHLMLNEFTFAFFFFKKKKRKKEKKDNQPRLTIGVSLITTSKSGFYTLFI
jgi:hypothetical protein